MEFPDLGKRCYMPACKTLDFLPFTCAYCNQVFCKNHFNQDIHECNSYKETISKQSVIKTYLCSIKECTACSPVEMLCSKCNKHFCLVHRYHDCFDVVSDLEEKKKLWNHPREQFAESVKEAQNAVNEKIKKALKDPKKQSTATKIQLMRLKGKAVGSAAIPTSDRIYFLISLPKSSKKGSKAIFFSQDWSVGKVIDFAATTCSINNRNNEMNSPKLRLFKITDGTQISNDLSAKIKDVIDMKKVVNGETLALEYVEPNEDLTNFVLNDCSEYDTSL